MSASSSRVAILLLAAVAVTSGLALALVRPPTPARLSGYRGPMVLLGRWAHFVSRPVLAGAVALGISANGMTGLGAALAFLAAGAAAIGPGAWGWAGVLLLLGSWCDLLDGELARTTGTQSPAGAFLDSNVDRLSEIALFAGLAAALPERSGVLWAVAALAASLMVSYARARGEGLGVACPTFGLERPHRLILLMSALLVSAFLAPEAALALVEGTCGLVAVGAGGTALARMVVIHHLLRRSEASGQEAPAQAQDAPGAPTAGAR
ncbi:MAG TPA: CDP-alcohol phosphatidyltransferase family protein [Anaeromyxobacter sp.]|nr:CDP-alcohol phosphatidyltransferase family protein [Anaeromyxobacter sp.]